MLKYGIVKERTSALLTDAIRAQILEDCGYNVDVMEFVALPIHPKTLCFVPNVQGPRDKRTSTNWIVLCKSTALSKHCLTLFINNSFFCEPRTNAHTKEREMTLQRLFAMSLNLEWKLYKSVISNGFKKMQPLRFLLRWGCFFCCLL